MALQQNGPTAVRLSQCITRAMRVSPDQIAIQFADRASTWAQVGDRVARLAAGLRRLGLERGDRVACLALNSDRYFEYFFAVAWAGGVFVPINTRLAGPEIVHCLTDSGVSILFVDDSFAPQVVELRPGLPEIREIVYLADGDPPFAGVHSFEDLVSDNAPARPSDVGGQELAGIFYTGGTTGRSKGVMLSHENLLSNAFHLLPVLGWNRHTHLLHSAPMFHVANGAGMFAMSVVGGTNTFVDRFRPASVLQSISEHRVSVALLVPTMIAMLVDHPTIDSYDLSSLDTLLYGGSPIAEAVIERSLKALPGVRMVQAYGQTEAGPILTVLGPERHVLGGPLAGKTRSAGQAAYGVEVAIFDPEGGELRRGEVGEICGRGDNVMLGYWNQPQATAKAIRDGWLHTGDAGYMDDDGFVFVVDRLKDMIITGGENVYTTEVENAIYRHPAVAECAVFGILDDQWGERVHAVVVLREDHPIAAGELIDHCRLLIADYKCPRSIELTSAPLPKNGAGKILKTELRAPYWKGRTRAIN